MMFFCAMRLFCVGFWFHIYCRHQRENPPKFPDQNLIRKPDQNLIRSCSVSHQSSDIVSNQSLHPLISQTTDTPQNGQERSSPTCDRDIFPEELLLFIFWNLSVVVVAIATDVVFVPGDEKEKRKIPVTQMRFRL
jgi:hypothetical protein